MRPVCWVLLAAAGWLLLTARRRGPTPAMWAGVIAGLTAFAAHSAVDFLWQLPAIPLAAAALIGLAAPARQPAAPRPPAPTHAPDRGPASAPAAQPPP